MFDATTAPTYASAPVSDLAKGLAAEAASKAGSGLKALATGRSDLFRLNPYSIKVRPGWNSRDLTTPENVEHIEALAKSIAEIGVQEPLTVYMDGDTPILTDGHCRLMATCLAIEAYGAEIKSVPVKTEPRGADERDRLLSQLVRNSGKRLTPLEQGNVYKRLLDLGWTEAEIAKKTGANPQLVTKYLDLRAAPSEVQAMVSKGEVSATFAMQVIGEQGAAKATAILGEAVAEAKASGKKKATAKTVEKVAGATPPVAKVSGKKEALALEVVRSLVKALDSLMVQMPEFDSEEHVGFHRAYAQATDALADAEKFLEGKE
jgi:ParB-like chromosome segregation protein Spo0J